MRKVLASALLAAAVAAAVPSVVRAQANEPPARIAAAQTQVPVKIVVLFSSGVGYFEHVGSVEADATTELRFKTAQINDILKSLVLQDTGGGRVSTVVYPSLDPLARTLKSFQVDVSSNPPLADLLNQLRGARVRILFGDQKVAGTVLGVEKKPKAVEKGSIEVWQLNLVSDGRIRPFPLDDLTEIQLEDPQLQEELNKALAALSQSRDQDKKPVTIQFQGQGRRSVRIGYVVETPIWKTSYRLLLPTDAKDKAGLQGWAIVENQTDNDWKDVQLSLVSGRPISFIQELYQPLYVPRPVVQPELYASLRPQTYEEGQRAERLKELDEVGGALQNRGLTGLRRSQAAAKQEVASVAGAAGAPARDAKYGEVWDKPLDASASVASVASAQKIGELFQYTVGNVTLPRQRSAMIPIITDPIEVEKLSIYNASVLQKNPLNGARVKNTTDKHLLQGPITVLEGSSYAGDARIDNLPPGQERLVSYGIDLQMLVNSTKNKQESSIQTGKIVKGVLHISRKHVFTQEYLAENKDGKDRVLIIEHPFRQGWKLIEPEKPMETTETLYRFRTGVPAGKQSVFAVREQHVQEEKIAILPMDVTALETYFKAAEIPQDVRDALSRAAAMKQAVVDAQRQVDQTKAQIAQIGQEQARIRENVKVAPDRTEYRNRLLSKLNEQESQIDGLYQQMQKAQEEVETRRKAFEDYLGGLTVG